MRLDVAELQQFYGTGLGRLATRTLSQRIREAWPDVAGLRVLGLGYATPCLRACFADAERVLAAMPAAQGVVRWPKGAEPNRVFLADEAELPLPDQSVDRVLLIHALENSEHVRPLLREVWRVLPASGRLLAVVPNRRGIWARLERTPFGHGRPFSPPQLLRLLSENLFTPAAVRPCLFTPPLRGRFVLRSAPAFENLGEHGLGIGGVLVAEASKQIYAVTALRVAPARKRATAVVPSPDPT